LRGWSSHNRKSQVRIQSRNRASSEGEVVRIKTLYDTAKRSPDRTSDHGWIERRRRLGTRRRPRPSRRCPRVQRFSGAKNGAVQLV